VAVKTVKEGASSREKDDLLRELEIMQQLGSHANVVTLLGCCTEKGKMLKHWLVAVQVARHRIQVCQPLWAGVAFCGGVAVLT
jgi:serine/threonine protein kinase